MLRLGLLGGGTASIVLPALVATGFKDYEGHGKKNRDTSSGGTSSNSWSNTGSALDSSKTKSIGDNATRIGKGYGISVGRIPWKTKITGKLDNKCKNGSSSAGTITLGSDRWNVGRKDWKTNKNLFGEVQFECQNKKGTLFLKWEGNSKKQGWYGRVAFNK
ncbi:hypothetical protein [Candidatus Mycoplasma haematominutum]|nr:hypothetical protein [Candidatus Mycoplasma haematominutum]